MCVSIFVWTKTFIVLSLNRRALDDIQVDVVRWSRLDRGCAAGACASFLRRKFDANKPIKLTGPVTKVEWMNPHAYFYVDAKDETGSVANRALEMGSINGLDEGGWTESTLKLTMWSPSRVPEQERHASRQCQGGGVGEHGPSPIVRRLQPGSRGRGSESSRSNCDPPTDLARARLTGTSSSA